MGVLVQLPVSEIVVDLTMGVRQGLDEETIQNYMQCYDELPPIEVWELTDRGGVKMLVDGFHRNAARERLGRTTCAARLFKGTWAQAHERSIVANVRHGRRYTIEERRRAAREMLKLHPDWADNYLAQRLGNIVTAPTIKALRVEMTATGEIPLHDRLLGADGKWRPREYESSVEEQSLPPTILTPPSRHSLSPACLGGNEQPSPEAVPPLAAYVGPKMPAGAAKVGGDGAEAGRSEAVLVESGDMPRVVPALTPTAQAPVARPSPSALLIQADAAHLPLADESVHMEVVSPPYYGMREYHDVVPTVWGGDSTCAHEWDTVGNVVTHGAFCWRCGAWRGTLGLEPSLDLYIAHLVEILNGEAWRVLRGDGTLWLNIGDTYAGSNESGLRPGNLVAAPWRVGLALQGFAVLPATTLVEWADLLREARDRGDWEMVEVVERRLRLNPLVAALAASGRWKLRSEIIWAKGVSGQKELRQQVYRAALEQGVAGETAASLADALEPYVGNPMPSSVRGVRWERHRVRREGGAVDEYVDCPGCPRCKPFGGYVLRRGNWRPTGSFEVILLLSKPGSYYCDGEAVREEYAGRYSGNAAGFRRGDDSKYRGQPTAYGQRADSHRPDGTADACTLGGRNLRAVWTIPVRGYHADHYAAFPLALPELCIKAGTSEAGVCPRCGAPWARIIQREDFGHTGRAGSICSAGSTAHRMSLLRQAAGAEGQEFANRVRTSGFYPTCDCRESDGGLPEPVPATVLDFFCGSGTTGKAALALGRRFIGVDMSYYYLDQLARARLAGEGPQDGARTVPVSVVSRTEEPINSEE